MTDYQTIIFALLGGVLPALVWLFFWLREDRKRPEPKGLIAWTFLLGMGAVILTQEMQIYTKDIFGIGGNIFVAAIPLMAIVTWVVLEEVLKLAAASIGGLYSTEDDEPIDPIVYMITAALGFAAMENTLFIFGWLSDENITTSVSVMGGNFRFIGATLLHVISSAAVGVAIGLSFYKPRLVKAAYIATGLALSVAFHTGFNLVVLHWKEHGTPIAFGTVWVGVVLLLLAFEKVKTIAPERP